jgi:hypothetical protein
MTAGVKKPMAFGGSSQLLTLLSYMDFAGDIGIHGVLLLEARPGGLLR